MVVDLDKSKLAISLCNQNVIIYKAFLFWEDFFMNAQKLPPKKYIDLDQLFEENEEVCEINYTLKITETQDQRQRALKRFLENQSTTRTKYKKKIINETIRHYLDLALDEVERRLEPKGFRKT
jgi:hypothetical protein